MKRIVLIVLAVIALTACDKIKNPKVGGTVVVAPSGGLDTTVVQTNTATSNVRKILIEDYTGHFCGNCPRAARHAEALLDDPQYAGKIVVIACHVSIGFAAPQADTIYKQDFRNSTGDDWDLALGMSSKGLPEGAVNRGGQPSYPQGDFGWAALAAAALTPTQSAAKLDITTSYSMSTRQLSAKIKTTFLQSVPANVKLIVVLTQDSIIAPQKDYYPPSGAAVFLPDIRLNYVFNNLLLGSIYNGSTGQLVKASPAIGDTLTVNLSHILEQTLSNDGNAGEIATSIDDKQVHLVAFVYRDDTKEILQVEKLKITGGIYRSKN